MPILRKDNNIAENFGLLEADELKEQDIETDHRNLVCKSLDIRSCAKDDLLGHIT